MANEVERIFAEAEDGKRFDVDSPEVRDFLNAHPEVNLDAALGTVVGDYNKTLKA